MEEDVPVILAPEAQNEGLDDIADIADHISSTKAIVEPPAVFDEDDPDAGLFDILEASWRQTDAVASMGIMHLPLPHGGCSLDGSPDSMLGQPCDHCDLLSQWAHALTLSAFFFLEYQAMMRRQSKGCGPTPWTMMKLLQHPKRHHCSCVTVSRTSPVTMTQLALNWPLASVSNWCGSDRAIWTTYVCLSTLPMSTVSAVSRQFTEKNVHHG